MYNKLFYSTFIYNIILYILFYTRTHIVLKLHFNLLKCYVSFIFIIIVFI